MTDKEKVRLEEILEGRNYEDIITQAIKAKRDTVFIREFLNKLKDASFEVESKLENYDKNKEWSYKIFSNCHVFEFLPKNDSMGFRGDDMEELVKCIKDFVKNAKKEKLFDLVERYNGLLEILEK